MISRFKVLGGMDIAEKRAPQDGHFTHRFGPSGQALDIRLATLPTRHGERMTVRLLALQTESLTLERLGMSPADLAAFSEAIDKPHGLILLDRPDRQRQNHHALRRLAANHRPGAAEHRHHRGPDRVRDLPEWPRSRSIRPIKSVSARPCGACCATIPTW